MDSTPPYRSEPKWDQAPHRPLGLVHSSASPKNTPSPKKTLLPSPLSLRSSGSLPLQELLLLSPSPLRRSKTRLADRIEMTEESMEAGGTRRRCKSRASQMGLLSCASPRNTRRSRRRSEMEIREEKDLGLVEELGKPRKRRQSGRSKKEKLSLVLSVPSSSPKIDEEDQGSLNRIGQLMNDLIMWKDVARSSLWFGFGAVFFLSSCFTKGISFSIFSVLSQLGFLVLCASFFSKSICQRNSIESKRVVLKEDDILRVAKLILPATNLAISKTREIFSGEPAMTLKVAPVLILGAEYGHLLTLWRLCALGFFVTFTVPKLYSYYSIQINQKAEYLKWWFLEAWGTCSHKKIVAASAATAFWNLSSVKTRIFTAFIVLVLFRSCQRHVLQKVEDEEAEEEQEQQQALIVADTGGSSQQ